MRKELTVYECIKQHGRETVWLNKENEQKPCKDVPTAQSYDTFEIDRIVTKWWYEPENCLCMLVK